MKIARRSVFGFLTAAPIAAALMVKAAIDGVGESDVPLERGEFGLASLVDDGPIGGINHEPSAYWHSGHATSLFSNA